MQDRSFVSHHICSRTGEKLPAGEVQNLSPAGAPILVQYDLDAVRSAMTREKLTGRDLNFWRYRELLPVSDPANIVSLGEQFTPLVPLAGSLGGQVMVKDESRLPTGSFKARGLGMAVSMAKELGLKKLAIPTNGNAGAALSAYASRAGMEAFVFCPDDTPDVNVKETALQGAHVWRVNGLINDCGHIVGEGEKEMGWFNVATLKEPYRVEGKKTMGIELAEQLGWQVPDLIFYPTGGGTGLIGMWKAFDELEAIGFIGPERPRMVAVQSEGCAPIVRAWKAGKEEAEIWENASTAAAGIRVPVALGDFLILRALKESGGFAIAVDDDAIMAAQQQVGREEGLLLCPEGAATVAGYQAALDQGLISKSDRAVLFNCGNGLKYPMPPAAASLDRHQPIDWGAIASTS
ncbi:threonine synthase [Parasphingorhabdus marina DSM 22363]|uniref:Threonine synthase n=1 Tax=Parasphingorhabdus marina DSM 22363 TaxID=1123272 RepID=A0A1N6CR37_9SPHN|nr:threonine synthase [Parasphingorhabdus marina]SIN60992.1 threonine synthase [Parasphingorhabdus marina DSM 22363]